MSNPATTDANRLTSADLDALMIARSVCRNAVEYGTTALPERVLEAADRLEALVRANTPFSKETDAFCPYCAGRGYIGEPTPIYPETPLGSASMDPYQRFAVETCPACKGSGQHGY